jgi:hypothetical protein
MVIPKSQLNNVIFFNKVSQGKPRFVLKNYGSGPK